jgi:hypothetical protein
VVEQAFPEATDEFATAVNAAAVVGSTGSSGAPSSAVRGADILGDLDVPAGDVVIPPEQIFQPADGGLVALLDEGAFTFDGSDLGDLRQIGAPGKPSVTRSAASGSGLASMSANNCSARSATCASGLSAMPRFYSNTCTKYCLLSQFRNRLPTTERASAAPP